MLHIFVYIYHNENQLVWTDQYLKPVKSKNENNGTINYKKDISYVTLRYGKLACIVDRDVPRIL